MSVQAKCVCGRTPCDGLDCGPYLPGQAPRKKAAKKPPHELAAIREKAWETRRRSSSQDRSSEEK